MKFKKPKFWDLKKPNFISILLLPFTLPVQLNNFFLKNKASKKIENITSICVGNIYIGGTGKTPTAIKLNEILKELNVKSCIGKKYYPSHIDEKMILEKNSDLITLSNRKEIIRSAVEKNYKFLIFDDGLQDKNVYYDIELVCFDADSWIGNGNLLPSGPLREKISSLKKYDAVFLKTNDKIQDDIKQKIKSYNPKIEIFNTCYEIKNLDKFDLSKKYLFFCGLGNPNNFKNTLLKYKFKIKKKFIFADHHKFYDEEILSIKEIAKKNKLSIITTEKDFLRLSSKQKKGIKFLKIKLKIKNLKKLNKILFNIK